MMRSVSFFLVIALFGVAAPVRSAVDQELIRGAIERGVAYLKSLQGGDGMWRHGTNDVGASALAGVTLIECGVKRDDPSVARTAAAVRSQAPQATQTYSIALALVFLDALQDPADMPLIQVLGVRLLAGQNGTGGWSYQCPRIGSEADFVRALTTGKRKPTEPGIVRITPEMEAQLREAIRLNTAQAGGGGDNSNTQFATLGLWIARRHGIPVKQALDRVALRFRTSQNADGGWGYTGGGGTAVGGSTAAMTAAALFGLAAWHGADSIERDPENAKDGKTGAAMRDVNLKAGLLALSTAIGQPVGVRREIPRGAVIPSAGGRSYYFLWSVERLGMAMGLETIGGKDWYNWGAEILLVNQQANGSWRGEHAESGADTCFALLFLSRANFTGDLSRRLKNLLRDPRAVTLKAGGVGGEGLLSGKPTAGLKPAIEPGTKTSASGTGTRPLGEPTRVERPAAAPSVSDPAAAKLMDELVRASPSERKSAIEKLRDGKGVIYTEALAGAIAQLGGAERNQAREALAERLSRMKNETLARYLSDDSAEIRRAGALALAMRESRDHIPNLIGLLRDREPAVARAAHAALKELTGKQDIGLDLEAWKAWWSKQNR